MNTKENVKNWKEKMRNFRLLSRILIEISHKLKLINNKRNQVPFISMKFQQNKFFLCLSQSVWYFFCERFDSIIFVRTEKCLRFFIHKSANLSWVRDWRNLSFKRYCQGIETRLNAYGPLYVKKPPKYWFWFLVKRKSNKFKSKHLKLLTHAKLLGQSSRREV